MTTLKRYPTATSRLGIPTRDRRSALAGIALYAPSKRSSELFRDLSRLAVLVAGPRILPGERFTFLPPVEEGVWSELCDRISVHVSTVDAFAVYGRSGGRSGFTLAVIGGGRQLAVLRVELASARGVETECRALRALERAKPRSFVAPRLLEEGAVGEWAYDITEPIAMGAHRAPVDPDLTTICRELSEAMDMPDRPVQVADHWVPAHGDLTPWNLRERRGGPPALLDWESVTWAPPGTDVLLYQVSAIAIGRGPRPDAIRSTAEAVDFVWQSTEQRIKEATEAGVEPDLLNDEILRALDAVSRGVER